MSENVADQLKDLRRLKAQWEDDPDQRTPFPLTDLLETLEEMVDTGDADGPSPDGG